MSGSLTLNLQAVLLRNWWLALQSYLQVLSVNWDPFPPSCFAGSTDFQLPLQWETEAHPCVLHPCPDTRTRCSTGKYKKAWHRTKVVSDSSRVCWEDEQGTSGLSDHSRRQVIQGLSEQSHLADSAVTSEQHRAALQFLRKKSWCAPLSKDFGKLQL